MKGLLLLLLTVVAAAVAFVPLPAHRTAVTRSSTAARPKRHLAAAADSEAAAPKEAVPVPTDQTAIVHVEGAAKEGGVGARLRRFFKGDKANRQKLAKLGIYFVLSYGFVSNASYAICLCVSWYIASKRSGLSPLAPGQWQYFLGIYGSMFLLNNVIRPARLALSVALAPAFDRLIALIMAKTGRSRGFATGVCVLAVNVVGTTLLMGSGILLASVASGVPIWARA